MIFMKLEAIELLFHPHFPPFSLDQGWEWIMGVISESNFGTIFFSKGAHQSSLKRGKLKKTRLFLQTKTDVKVILFFGKEAPLTFIMLHRYPFHKPSFLSDIFCQKKKRFLKLPHNKKNSGMVIPKNSYEAGVLQLPWYSLNPTRVTFTETDVRDWKYFHKLFPSGVDNKTAHAHGHMNSAHLPIFSSRLVPFFVAHRNFLVVSQPEAVKQEWLCHMYSPNLLLLTFLYTSLRWKGEKSCHLFSPLFLLKKISYWELIGSSSFI